MSSQSTEKQIHVNICGQYQTTQINNILNVKIQKKHIINWYPETWVFQKEKIKNLKINFAKLQESRISLYNLSH